MAWVKVPAEHHPIFRANLPRGATTKNMFGGIAAFVNDNMFGGLFARSVIVKLSAADQDEALALDGASRFDPMGNGRIMRDIILMPESMMDELDELRAWLQRAFDHVKTRPPKKTAPSARSRMTKARVTKPTQKRPEKRAAKAKRR